MRIFIPTELLDLTEQEIDELLYCRGIDSPELPASLADLRDWTQGTALSVLDLDGAEPVMG